MATAVLDQDVPGRKNGGLRRLTFVVPGDLNTSTGGYCYDKRIIEELRRLGWQVDILDIGDGFPFPSHSQRVSALTMMSKVPAGCPIIIDGLAFGTLPEVGPLQSRTPLIALVHQPLALESALTPKQAQALLNSERAALAAAAAVIVTSEATAQILADDYGVPIDHLNVVRPGNDPVSQATGSSDGIVRLISVGSVVPGKGYDVLIAALATMADMPWRLTIIGDRTRNPHCAAQLDADIERYGLAGRVAVLGALPADRVMALYLVSDVFALASHFEGYGMALAEAVAHGLPIVSTTAGAIPDTVPAEAGLLVPPGDVPALARALRRLIGSPAERRLIAANARMAAVHLPSWQDSARRFAAAVERIDYADPAISERRLNLQLSD